MNTMSQVELKSTVELQAHYRAVKERLKNAPVKVKDTGLVRHIRNVVSFEELEQRRREAIRNRMVDIHRRIDADIERHLSYVGGVYRHRYRRVEERLCSVFGVTRWDILSQRRHNDIVFARQAIMYWSIRLTLKSYPEIGRIMQRDHTSVIHGVRSYVEKRGKQGRTLRPIAPRIKAKEGQ